MIYLFSKERNDGLKKANDDLKEAFSKEEERNTGEVKKGFQRKNKQMLELKKGSFKGGISKLEITKSDF